MLGVAGEIFVPSALGGDLYRFQQQLWEYFSMPFDKRCTRFHTDGQENQTC